MISQELQCQPCNNCSRCNVNIKQPYYSAPPRAEVYRPPHYHRGHYNFHTTNNNPYRRPQYSYQREYLQNPPRFVTKKVYPNNPTATPKQPSPKPALPYGTYIDKQMNSQSFQNKKFGQTNHYQPPSDVNTI